MIHHITAICADAQATTDFYTEVLGLRLVKVTVNQDDVGTYHIYFGDRLGRPGTVLTFFPWKDLPTGRAGPGMVSAVAFSVPEDSIGYWQERLEEHVSVSRSERFGETVLSFPDPDGMQLELIGRGEPGDWASHGVPEEYAVNGFHSATLELDGYEKTASILTNLLGFSPGPSAGERFRFDSDASVGTSIDLLETPAGRPGQGGHGTVHHIAFRGADYAAQVKMRQAVRDAGLNPTPPIERFYFRSVYFREPGGVLFEIATDGPGFAIDEDEDSLGTSLVLPPFLEDRRTEIEGMLEPFSFG